MVTILISAAFRGTALIGGRHVIETWRLKRKYDNSTDIKTET